MSSKDYESFIQENNREVVIENVLKNNLLKKKLLANKKGNHVSFFVDNIDYLESSETKKVVCVRCTDTFFNIFFSGMKDENDKVMEEIFKSKVYMKYYPQEQIFRCPNNPEHTEILRDPQITDKKEKRLLGAGIESFPEYQGYLDPDTVRGDYIGTANVGKKKTGNKKPFFYEESEDEIFDRYINGNRS